MVGLEFGSSTASFVWKIHQAFMKMHGLDPSTLRVINIDGAARVPMLAARKVQAIDLFVMSEPGIRRAVKDAEPKCFLLGDHGLDIYANGIGVTEEFLQKNPEVVRGFIRAALRGWKDALANPEEASKMAIPISRAASVLASAVPRVSWKCMASRFDGMTCSRIPMTPCTCIGVPTPMVSPTETS